MWLICPLENLGDSVHLAPCEPGAPTLEMVGGFLAQAMQCFAASVQRLSLSLLAHVLPQFSACPSPSCHTCCLSMGSGPSPVGPFRGLGWSCQSSYGRGMQLVAVPSPFC